MSTTKRKTRRKPRQKKYSAPPFFGAVVLFVSWVFAPVVWLLLTLVVIPLALVFGFQNALGKRLGAYLKTRPSHRLRGVVFWAAKSL